MTNTRKERRTKVLGRQYKGTQNETNDYSIRSRLDRRTLRYIYRMVICYVVNNKNKMSGSEYDSGKDRAYREVLGMISDILSD